MSSPGPGFADQQALASTKKISDLTDQEKIALLKGEIDNLRTQINGKPHTHYGWKESKEASSLSSASSSSSSSSSAAFHARVPLLSVTLVVALLYVVVTRIRNQRRSSSSSSTSALTSTYNRSYRRHLGSRMTRTGGGTAAGRFGDLEDGATALFELQESSATPTTATPTTTTESLGRTYEAPDASTVRFV